MAMPGLPGLAGDFLLPLAAEGGRRLDGAALTGLDVLAPAANFPEGPEFLQLWLDQLECRSKLSSSLSLTSVIPSSFVERCKRGAGASASPPDRSDSGLLT